MNIKFNTPMKNVTRGLQIITDIAERTSADEAWIRISESSILAGPYLAKKMYGIQVHEMHNNGWIFFEQFDCWRFDI